MDILYLISNIHLTTYMDTSILYLIVKHPSDHIPDGHAIVNCPTYI